MFIFLYIDNQTKEYLRYEASRNQNLAPPFFLFYPMEALMIRRKARDIKHKKVEKVYPTDEHRSL